MQGKEHGHRSPGGGFRAAAKTVNVFVDICLTRACAAVEVCFNIKDIEWEMSAFSLFLCDLDGLEPEIDCDGALGQECVAGQVEIPISWLSMNTLGLL